MSTNFVSANDSTTAQDYLSNVRHVLPKCRAIDCKNDRDLTSVNRVVLCLDDAAVRARLLELQDMAKKFGFVALNAVCRLNDVRMIGVDHAHAEEIWMLLACMYYQGIVFDVDDTNRQMVYDDVDAIVPGLEFYMQERARNENQIVFVSSFRGNNRPFRVPKNLPVIYTAAYMQPSDQPPNAADPFQKVTNPIFYPVYAYYKSNMDTYAARSKDQTNYDRNIVNDRTRFNDFAEQILRVRRTLGEVQFHRFLDSFRRARTEAELQFSEKIRNNIENGIAWPRQRLDIDANTRDPRTTAAHLDSQNHVVMKNQMMERAIELLGSDAEARAIYAAVRMNAEAFANLWPSRFDSEIYPLSALVPNTFLLRTQGTERERKVLETFLNVRMPDRTPPIDYREMFNALSASPKNTATARRLFKPLVVSDPPRIPFDMMEHLTKTYYVGANDMMIQACPEIAVHELLVFARFYRDTALKTKALELNNQLIAIATKAKRDVGALAHLIDMAPNSPATSVLHSLCINLSGIISFFLVFNQTKTMDGDVRGNRDIVKDLVDLYRGRKPKTVYTHLTTMQAYAELTPSKEDMRKILRIAMDTHAKWNGWVRDFIAVRRSYAAIAPFPPFDCSWLERSFEFVCAYTGAGPDTVVVGGRVLNKSKNGGYTYTHPNTTQAADTPNVQLQYESCVFRATRSVPLAYAYTYDVPVRGKLTVVFDHEEGDMWVYAPRKDKQSLVPPDNLGFVRAEGRGNVTETNEWYDVWVRFPK